MSQLGLGMTAGPPRAPGRRGGGGAVLLALTVVICVFAVLALVVYHWLHQSQDYAGPGYSSVVVTVPSGASTADIANILQKNDVVRSASTFLNAAAQNPSAQDIQPGEYGLKLHMSAAQALDTLIAGTTRISRRVVIPEGLRVAATAKLIAAQGHVSLASVDAALAAPASFGLPAYAHGNPEGYLFPATYTFSPGTSATAMLAAMVARYEQSAGTQGIVAGAARLGLSPEQLMTVASIAQVEGGTPADYPKIARVIYNRLAAGMKLQLDSTVNYALGNYGALSYADLTTPSPYNTYVVTGLPPTPIASPGDAAIAGALNPAAGNWLYYVTVNPATGLTLYTSSYSQFLTFTQQLKANQAAQASPSASSAGG